MNNMMLKAITKIIKEPFRIIPKEKIIEAITILMTVAFNFPSLLINMFNGKRRKISETVSVYTTGAKKINGKKKTLNNKLITPICLPAIFVAMRKIKYCEDVMIKIFTSWNVKRSGVASLPINARMQTNKILFG